MAWHQSHVSLRVIVSAMNWSRFGSSTQEAFGFGLSNKKSPRPISQFTRSQVNGGSNPSRKDKFADSSLREFTLKITSSRKVDSSERNQQTYLFCSGWNHH